MAIFKEANKDEIELAEEEGVVRRGPGRPAEEEKEENSNLSDLSNLPKEEKITITLDNTIEDIVKYQEEGKEIFFEDDADTFIELSMEDQAKLNALNRTKYTLACGIRYQKLNLSGINDSKKIIKPRPGFASATARLEVRGKKPGKHYSWKRPDELQAAEHEGTRVCRDPDVITFGGVDENGRSIHGSGVKTVSANGVTELILCETPAEVHNARMESIAELSVRRNKAVDTTAKSQLSAAGGNPFVPDEAK